MKNGSFFILGSFQKAKEIHMKKIYITALHMLHGGVELAIANLSDALAALGYDVEILCVYNLGEPAYKTRAKITYLTDFHPNKKEFRDAVRSKNPIRILREGLYAVRVLRGKKVAMRRAIASVSEGVIISSRHEDSLILSKYGREGVLKIAQLHHDHCFDRAYIEGFKNGYGNIDHFVLLTEGLRDEAAEMMKGSNDRTQCHAIGNFLNISDGERLVSEDIPRKPQIVAVGRLDPVKGFDRLLRMWADISARHPDWKLKIIGGGDEMDRLVSLRDELGITDSAELCGMQPYDVVTREMASSAAFAMTSRNEGFGLVIVEAMNCGTPVVAFDVRVGPGAILTDGVDGFLVKDEDEAAYCRKLESLMDDEEMRRRMSDNAREGSKRFSRDAIVGKWVELIEG